MFSADEIDMPWLTAADVAEVTGVPLELVKAWSTRGLVSWSGSKISTYQRRTYTLRSAVEARTLRACADAGTSLDPQGVALAAELVRRLRHHQERGIESLLGVDEDEAYWLAFSFLEEESRTTVRGTYVLWSQPVSELLGHLPLPGGGWELRLFPADYFLLRLVDDYLSLRRHKGEQWESALLGSTDRGKHATELEVLR
jgi:hypothetical protein